MGPMPVWLLKISSTISEAVMTRKLILGIDTGGTHTHAAVFDFQARQVLASAKAPKTHHVQRLDLSEVIAKIVALQWTRLPDAIASHHPTTTIDESPLP